MKKIWASVLSSKGMVRSKTRARLIGVDPISGDSSTAPSARAPKSSSAVRILVRTGFTGRRLRTGERGRR